MTIEIYDNALSKQKHEQVFTLVRTKPYTRLELDNPDQKIHEATATYSVPKGPEYQMLINYLFEASSTNIDEYSCSRAYYNAFHFGDTPEFHTDSSSDKDLTLLYYPNLQWHPKLGGETMFVQKGKQLANGLLHAIVPVPNRLVKFDPTLLHSARAPLYQHLVRYSVALKLTFKG